MRLFYQDL